MRQSKQPRHFIMGLRDWLDLPYCHDPLHLNRFHAAPTGAVGLDRRERLPLHEPAPRAGRHQHPPCTTSKKDP